MSPQFLQMHGTLINFNCQPVEKNPLAMTDIPQRLSKGWKELKYTVQVSVMQQNDPRPILRALHTACKKLILNHLENIYFA